ncbi:MAG TPA: hypothetical protein VGQ95_12205 [Chthoniobacterales bacterium]|nr:hypothetical protein [Chthoniobacterales bacterium]
MKSEVGLLRAKAAAAAVRCETLADRATHAVADRDSRHTFSATVSFDESYEDGQGEEGLNGKSFFRASYQHRRELLVPG